MEAKEKEEIVFNAIKERYSSSDTLINQLKDDSDIVYSNIAYDIDHIVEEDEIEDIIYNKLMFLESLNLL
jgi:hypothetical protein